MIEEKQTPSDSAKSSGEDEILQDKNTNFLGLFKSDIQSNLMKLSVSCTEPALPHKEILNELLNQVDTIDFDLLAFARMQLVEQVGSGINRMTDLMKEAGLPEPTYTTDGIFTVKLIRPVSEGNKLGDKLGDKLGNKLGNKLGDKLGDKLGNKLGKKQAGKSGGKNSDKARSKIVEIIASNNDITIPELAKMVGLTNKGVEYHIAKMKTEKIIDRVDSRKAGQWVILSPKKTK